MDSLELLARENEFKKLNRQLEKKTESLMKEIEHVMQKQDMFPDFSQNLRITPSPKNLKRHSCDSSKVATSVSGSSSQNNAYQLSKVTNNKTKEIIKDAVNNKTIVNNKEQYNCDIIKQSHSNCMEYVLCHNCMIDKNGRLSNDLEFLYAFVSINVTEKILPRTFLKERVTVESVCKFLSAKVKLLEEQISKMQSAIDAKTQQCEGHLTHMAELESERMTLRNRAKSMRVLADDAKAKCTGLQNKLEEKERAFKEQRSVTDRLSVEIKQLRSKNAGLEARCAAQEDAVDTLKQQLETARMAEKEFRDSSRQLSASHQGAITRLEARVKQLTGCVDKQNALIDNLKRQIALLLSESALKHLEKEYEDFLNQDI